MSRQIPREIVQDLRRAELLEWWTLGWMTSVVVVMGLVMGSSQAMRTAWVEDVLSLIPAIVFLVALHFERKRPNAHFPFGFARVNSLAFLISAVALSAVGALLLFESVMTLLMREHPTIAPKRLFGEDVWMGWVMIGALAYSVVPPVILGRMKLPIARRLQDKVLHTDAMMQKADWMTGLAGIVGITGVAFGLWWADATAAAFISLNILHDGKNALFTATAELVDGAPRRLEDHELADDAVALKSALRERYPDAEIRLRETGRFIHAQIDGVRPEAQIDLEALWPDDPDRKWRLAQISFVPPGGQPD